MVGGLLGSLFGGAPQAQAPGATQQRQGLASILDPQIALPMAAALLGNQGNAANFGNAFAAAAPAIQQRRDQNKTLEFFKTQAPEFAGLVEAGMPLDEAWEAYTKQRFAQTTDPYKSVGGAIFDTRDQSWLTPPGGGRSEYGLTPQTGVDENGNPVLIQLGKDGTSIRTPLPEGVTLSKEPIKLDAGTHFVLLDPITRQPVGQIAKENYQEAFDSGAGAAAGKRSVEMPAMRSKALSTLDALDQQRMVVDDDINRTIAAVQANPSLTTGLVGGLSAALPGTPAYQVAKKLETIKANIGFDKLQTMRENSPTGGALGQVSDFENRQLQSVFGNLEQAQNAEEIVYNLQRLQKILAESKDGRRRAFSRDFGELAPGSANGGASGGTPQRLRFNPATGELE